MPAAKYYCIVCGRRFAKKSTFDKHPCAKNFPKAIREIPQTFYGQLKRW